MEILLQQLTNGLVLGCIYALVALGYTMVYGILGLINFAHGEVVMVGALTGISAIQLLKPHINSPLIILILALIIAMLACISLAYSIERVAYRRLRNAPRLAPLITAIGISIILQNVAMMIWGKEFQPFPGLFELHLLSVGGASITYIQIWIVGITLLTFILLLTVIHMTRLGRAMRATAQSISVAQLMGVNTNWIISVTFMLGGALGALAGIMVAANYGLAHYTMGFMLGLKAFTAAVLGGIGNLRGAMFGGILLGLIESLTAGYLGDITGGFLGSHYQDIIAFFVLIAVLVFRPHGLFGIPSHVRA